MATSAGERDATGTAAPQDGRAGGLARLASAFAHEVRNPLNTLVLTIQFLERLLAREPLARREDVERHLGAAGREAARIQRVVDAFVDLARPRPLAIAPVDLAALLKEAAEAARATAGRPIEVALEAPRLEWPADAAQLKVALQALLTNAIEASPSGAAVEARLERTAEGAPRLLVADAGPGFSETARMRVPEPFFTTKPGHAGLGLARAALVAAAHGGRLAFLHAARGGAEVALELGLRSAQETSIDGAREAPSHVARAAGAERMS